MTAVGFEPTPLRTGAWNQRLRPLGQTVLQFIVDGFMLGGVKKLNADACVFNKEGSPYLPSLSVSAHLLASLHLSLPHPSLCPSSVFFLFRRPSLAPPPSPKQESIVLLWWRGSSCWNRKNQQSTKISLAGKTQPIVAFRLRMFKDHIPSRIVEELLSKWLKNENLTINKNHLGTENTCEVKGSWRVACFFGTAFRLEVPNHRLPRLLTLQKSAIGKKSADARKHKQNQLFFRWLLFFENGLQARSAQKMLPQIAKIAKNQHSTKNQADTRND